MVRELSTNPKTVYNRNYQARKRAEKKAAAEQTLDAGMPLDIDENAPIIEVAEQANKPKPSLKDRLMGKVKQPPTDHRKRAKKVDANLTKQLAPTLIATFVATYSRQMIQDPYKMCAPSQEEVLAMVAPYFNILSRYIEVTGQASENVLDLINAVLASIMYGVRAYVTYAMIKEGNKTHESPDELATRRSIEYRQKLETERQEYASSLENTTEANGPLGYPSIESSDAQNGYSDVEDGHSLDTRREADRVADLLARDVEGRKRLGLV